MNIIGELEFRNSVQNFASSPELDGAWDVITTEINGAIYVYVSGTFDAGIQILRMENNGDLTPIGSFEDTAATGLSGVRTLKIMEVGSETFLAATATSNDAITMFRIDDDDNGTDGELIWLDTYRNSPIGVEPTDAQGLIDYPLFADSVQIGSRTFFATAAYYSDAIAIFEVSSTGELTLRDSLTDADDANYNLATASGIQFHTVGSNTYLFTSSSTGDSGISVFRVGSGGGLTNVNNYEMGFSVNLEELVVMDFNGQTYMFVENNSLSKIYTFSVANNGTVTLLTETPNYINGSYSGLNGFQELVVDGVPFLLVSAASQDTLLLLSLDENNDLHIVESFQSAVELNGAAQITVRQIGSQTYVLVTATNNDSIAVFEVGGAEDALRGTMADDRMVGANGDDDILGRGGNDELLGGNGNDVLSGHRGADTLMGGEGDDVLVGGQHTDRIEGGAGADIMSGGAGTDFLNYETSRFAVRVDLQNGGASGGDAAGDIFVGFENVTGTERGDRLSGDGGVNRLIGGSGNDTLSGRDANDRLEGQDGDDVIYGGNNNDLIIGGSGNDTLVGGHGLDRILGGGGNDRMSGGVFRDRLYGNAGNDTIDGGEDDDNMGGGSGFDTFVFNQNFGNDIIGDFNVVFDTIDLSAISSITNMAQLNAAAQSFSGDTIIIIDSDNSIFLRGVVENDLASDNFIFV